MKKLIFLAIAALFLGLSAATAQSAGCSPGYCEVTVVNPVGSGGCCLPSGNIYGLFKWLNATSSIRSAHYGGPNGFTVEVSSDIIGAQNIIYQRITIYPDFPYNCVSGAHSVEFDHAVEKLSISPLSCCPTHTVPDIPPHNN